MPQIPIIGQGQLPTPMMSVEAQLKMASRSFIPDFASRAMQGHIASGRADINEEAIVKFFELAEAMADKWFEREMAFHRAQT